MSCPSKKKKKKKIFFEAFTLLTSAGLTMVFLHMKVAWNQTQTNINRFVLVKTETHWWKQCREQQTTQIRMAGSGEKKCNSNGILCSFLI